MQVKLANNSGLYYKPKYGLDFKLTLNCVRGLGIDKFVVVEHIFVFDTERFLC